MRQDDRPYLEIRITLIHIVIMIVAVVLLGFLLTYLGYQAGKSAATKPIVQTADTREYSAQEQELTMPTSTVVDVSEEQPPQNEPATIAASTPPVAKPTPTEPQPTASDAPSNSAIEQELKLHTQANLPASQVQTLPASTPPVSAKPVSGQEYFAIQVGAFGSFQNAKAYASKFSATGYKTEVVSSEGASGPLYRVWVGQYQDRALAMQEKAKLEKAENKKFALVSNR